MKLQPHTQPVYFDKAEQRQDCHSLRPWHEVAAEFTRRSGLRMTKTCARVTCRVAIRKIKRALEEA